MISLKDLKLDWWGWYKLYQPTFNKETIYGDLERKESNAVAEAYNSELVSKILEGPTARKLMSDKKTSNPREVIPELYALYLEEKRHPNGKIGVGRDKATQEYLVSERSRALYPLYIAEMANRIKNGPDFGKKTVNEILAMYRISNEVPNYWSWQTIFEPLFDSNTIIQDPEFRRYEGSNTMHGQFTKKSKQ
jgi:hypothetical protein